MSKGNKQKRKKQTAADRADRHDLYQQSVQCVEAECEFVEDTFKQLRGRSARTLREDFCGTANTATEWVRRSKRHRAIGVDLDDEVLEWGMKHNIGRLTPAAARRIALLNENVLQVNVDPTDVVLAMNFSYQLFKDRPTLRRYFKSVRKALVDDGVFFLDAYGGYDSYREIKESTRHKRFTYTWDQARYNPITGEMLARIHFSFPDGSKLKRAFSYSWRLWTLPETRGLLDEAGFSKVTVYWEGTDEETGEGDGVFTPATVGTPDPGWICYLSAEK